MVVGRILYWLFQKIFKHSVADGTRSFGVIFIDIVEEPLSLAIILFGSWFALDVLNLNVEVRHFFNALFYILVLFNIAWFITRFFDALIERYVVPMVKASETDLDDVLLPIVRKLIKITIWSIAIIIGADNAGYNVTAMITGLGLGGLAFALAAKDTVSNLFGGFVIFSDKPFSLNDRIVIDGFEGYVREIGLRSIRLQTFDGRMVTIPNALITDSAVLNVSKEEGRRVRFIIGLTYDTPIEKMEEAKTILHQVIEAHPNTEKATVGFESFGDFSLNILFIYWIKGSKEIVATQDAVNMQILKAYNEAGIGFAFPTQSIYLEKSES